MSTTGQNTGRVSGLRVAGATLRPVVVSRTVRRRNVRVARRPVAEMIADTGERWSAQTFDTESCRVPRRYHN